MFPTDVLIEWLDVKFPNWFALVSGCFLGILGVLALSFLVAVFAPDLLAFWMPLLILFAASSGGYTLRQKRPTSKNPSPIVLTLAAGLIVACVGGAVQLGVDHYLFHSRTGLPFMAIYAICGLAGAFLGSFLRSRYEKLLQSSQQA